MCMVLPVLVFGCRKPTDNDRPPSRASLLPYFNSNSLSDVLKPGLTKEDILRDFGKPTFEFPLSEGLTCMDYSRFNGTEPDESELAAFQIVMRSNQLLEWSPVYRQRSRPTPDAARYDRASEPSQTNDPQAVLKPRFSQKGVCIFLISDQAAAPATMPIGLPGPAGFVRTSPDLTLSAIKSVRKVIAEDGKSYQVLVKLAASDSEALRRFSQTNVSQRVLITARGEPISAPTIEAPIDTPTLALRVPTEAAADKIVRALSTSGKQ